MPAWWEKELTPLSGGDSTPLGDVPTPDDIPGSLRPASKSYTNADLTPSARRKAAGIMTAADLTSSDQAPTSYQTNGPVESEFDRIMSGSKAGLAQANAFMAPIEGEGNVAAEQSRAKYETPGEARAQSLGDTAVGIAKGVTHIPGDILAGTLGLPGTIASGYKSLADVPKYLADTESLSQIPKEAAGALKSGYEGLANDPESATRLFGGMIAAGPAGDLMLAGAKGAPGVVGGAMGKLGRGMQYVADNPLTKESGILRKVAAVAHPGLGTLAGAVGPEAVGLAGRGVEAAGNAVRNIPNSPALAAIKEGLNTDLGLAAQKAMTPELTPEEQAAASVRSTVDTAKQHVANGASRGQAAQRAGWPLAGDFELDANGHATNKYGPVDLGTHPGQNVVPNHPYQPTVRGNPTAVPGAQSPMTFADSVRAEAAKTNGTNHASSLGALDDLAGPSKRMQDEQVNGALADYAAANPSPYQTGVGAPEPMSPELMNKVVEAARRERVTRPGNLNTVDLSKADPSVLAEARKQIDYKLGYNTNDQVDLSHHVSPESNLAKLSKVRAHGRAARTGHVSE